MTPLLEVRGLRVHYPVQSGILQRVIGQVRAVDGVDLEVFPGETLGLVGESGCGKSTLSRALVRLVRPVAGEIRFDGRDILRFDRAATKRMRRDIQIIFQDPVGSLNPRLRVRDLVLEGRRIQGLADRATDAALVQEMLLKVGLAPELAGRYPHELSGGQRQRIGIARTLVLHPRLIVADEPVSALDVSIQSQVLNLLVSLRRELGLTYLFIAHNLAVICYIADRVAVMYLGKIVEVATSRDIAARPLHPYTVALLSAVPDAALRRRRNRVRLEGELPSPIDPPSGCRFRTRCPIAQPVCADTEPQLMPQADAHLVACHFAGAMGGTER
jgi:peptide/nickel transport system ATP-binding protein/oligopeptide transport system ATP-binding protein